jgi:hypothetical protein
MAIPGGRKRLSLTAISVVTEVTESLRVGSASRRRAIMRSRQIPVRWETDKRGLIDLPNPGDTCGARVFLTEAAADSRNMAPTQLITMPLRLSHASSPPEGYGGMESRDCAQLNTELEVSAR